MKNWMWETNWKGINFVDLGTRLTFFRRASEEFYEIFYAKLFDKYDCYDDLPLDTRIKKEDLAKSIAEVLKPEEVVLSIGCGEGFVETKITEILPDLTIHSFDFANNANRWMENNKRIKILQYIDDKQKYNTIYCSQLLYAISDQEMYQFLLMIKQNLGKGGIFLTVDYSARPSENGVVIDSSILDAIKQKLKNFLRPIYYLLFKRGEVIFWGWQRDNKELNKLFDKNGFDLVRNYSSCSQSFSIYTVRAVNFTTGSQFPPP